MGNTVVWKPASSAMFSAHYVMQLLEEAGLPPGVINFVAGDAAMISNVLLVAPRSRRRPLHRQHRASSTPCGRRSARRCRPTAPTRASSARPAARTSSSLIHRPIRRRWRSRSCAAGIEFQGQKCSAVSRVYVPRSLWTEVRDRDRRDDRRDQDGRRPGFPQLHGRGHRPARIRQDQRLSSTARAERRDDRRRRRVRRSHGILHPADVGRDDASRTIGCCARRSSGRS